MNFNDDYRMLIGGRLDKGRARIDVINPATEVVIATVPDAGQEDLDRAVSAAQQAFPGWAATSIEARKAKLIQLAEAITANLDDFKCLLTQEQGKPHADAQREIMGAGHWLKASTALELPVTVNEDSDERYSETRHVPLGIVGAIAPWNFPMLMAMLKIAPALLAGNTMVLKPSPFTPLCTVKFGELASKILPPGVLNIITGGDNLGPWMTKHSGFNKISFTGSTQTGRSVMASAAPTLKRLTLELGGNDPAIILPDVDVEKIAKDLFWAAFRNNGQVCLAIKRMYIHTDIYEPLRDALVAYSRSVKIGDGADQETQIGPLNNKQQYDRVRELIKDVKSTGATILTGGHDIERPGYFLPVTIIDNPPEDSRIVQEEQFGPILPLLRFNNIEDVVARVNASDYGLGASIWSKDEAGAYQLAQRISSGTVWVNEVQYLTPLSSFGGMKQSGIGVEGGVEGLLEYSQSQTLVCRKKPA